MNANQPIRGQESLYKLYNMKWFMKAKTENILPINGNYTLHRLALPN